MYFLNKKFSLLFIALLTMQSYTNAAEHPAHIHGMGQLTMVVEHNQVAMQLTIPAESIVGFEHQANTKQETKKIALAKEHLSRSKNVLYFNGTNCQLRDSSVETNNERDIDFHDSHDTRENADPHREFTIDYNFYCRNPSKISSIVMTIFKNYSDLKSIKAMWVNANKQGTKMLNATSKRIYLK